MLLTPGQRNDVTQAPALLDGYAPGAVLADRGYDADDILQLLAHLDVRPAGFQVATRVVVGDEEAPRVAEEAEPEHLAGARDRRVDRADVTDVGADHAGRRAQGDGQEDLPVVPVEELGAEPRRVSGRRVQGRLVAPVADEPDREDETSSRGGAGGSGAGLWTKRSGVWWP